MSTRRGLTLLELAVAIAVGGAALAAGGTVFATLVDRRAAMLAGADADERALTARRLLVSWISQVRVGATPDESFIGRRAMRRTAAGAIADDTLVFTTLADGTRRHVHLFVDRASGRPALVAELTATDGTSTRVVLAVGVAGLEGSYLSTAFGRREWRREWGGGALLPGAVMLHLSASEGDTLPAPLRLSITIPAANGQ
jgi:prepilin-type N-terminal cleavage/methylation domain-containing protein